LGVLNYAFHILWEFFEFFDQFLYGHILLLEKKVYHPS
jgi:hypothetical protein